ncbi:DUF3800 domain-containing protein [Corynebacterium felinum]|uniref:DUF3800 domain-containing protein n=1 Tax=Corynebacterium felinum TaxID=131318 RepID=A0ABU2B8J6_9CORY|nr:DUF3800 domain-containing protein [Corynebacterium felinum]MDF5820904.1 DUF3800 domain-containing protein [Corynebacterium felinum]MDR7354581.1 hypothetical protein [Corynebacterium felinum]WJY93948.1 hypothetical protein CFELI_01500 [Corynebacterium felinum]
MLLAYIDEIGQTGAFVSPTHARFSDSPAFGYGGFVIPAEAAREFGAYFNKQKRTLFKNEIPEGTDPNRWEKKGSDLLFARVSDDRPQNLRVFRSLISKLDALNGKLFYYAAEKPCGTPKETNTGPREFEAREENAMRETLNRLARHADSGKQQIMVMMDQINEKSRKQRLPVMYAHILGRATEHEDMRRIVEPPMHIDSSLSANIQFADWVCALVKRSIEYQLVPTSRYSWIPKETQLLRDKEIFTFESKLHLFHRAVDDICHSRILLEYRPVIDPLHTSTMNEENRKNLSESGKLHSVNKLEQPTNHAKAP